jgi:hypothetical protein
MDQKGSSKGFKNPFKSYVTIIALCLILLLCVLIFLLAQMPKSPGTDKGKIVSRSIKKSNVRSVIKPVIKPVTKPIMVDSEDPVKESKSDQPIEQENGKSDTASTSVTEIFNKEEAEKGEPDTRPARKASMPSDDVLTVKKEPWQEKDENRKLQGIKQNVFGKDFSMAIMADGPINKYRYFFLYSPPRLVIDLLGKWEKPKRFEIDIESDTVKKVRIWKYSDKLRLVNDLHREELLTPVFKKSSKGLLITLKKGAE